MAALPLSDDRKHDPDDVAHHDVKSVDARKGVLAAEKSPRKWSRPLLELYGYCAIAFLCSTMNGKTHSSVVSPQTSEASSP